MKKFFTHKYTIASLFAIGGLLLGWLIFHSPKGEENAHDHTESEVAHEIWTCSMHPQIRMDAPGKCPICGMDLILVNQSTSTMDSGAIHLTKEAAELANVLTAVAEKRKPTKLMRLYGKIVADERLQQSQVSHISGRIEQLSVNFTGEAVSKGQTLALIYSPQLVTAQQELIQAARTKESQPVIYEAVKEKLHQLKLTERQIAEIEQSGRVNTNVEVVANTSGIVAARRVNKGDYVSAGTVLFDITDLSSLWVQFDAYETDLAFLHVNDPISFTVKAIPGKQFSGKIKFIDPVIDAVTRVAKVRMEINNKDAKLKPEMFVIGTVEATLSEYNDNIVVPRTAVLWTGKRSIVYVKDPEADEPMFRLREVDLGPMLGDSYVIVSGLDEGEEIVSQGAFSVDAAAQLEGKPSMMNRPMASSSTEDKHKAHEMKADIKMTTKSFKVQGLCDMCRERIETAALSVKGVSTAKWDADSKQLELSINSDALKIIDVHRAIAAAGHDTELEKADDSVYNELPGCCQYR